jgi:GH3 auxin-responsive promoter
MNGWRQLDKAAVQPMAAFKSALLDPERAQSELLQQIVDVNADTEFGRRHDFARIRTVGDYRSALPIRSYAEFENDVGRMALGEPGILTSEPVIAFEETGGTSAGRKLIPHTRRSLGSFRAAALPWLSDLMARRPGVAAGRTFVSISPVTSQPKATAGGIPVGLNSDAAYLGEDLQDAFVSMLAVPPDVAALSDVEAWRLATLAALIECTDLSFISVWSPTFILNLIEAVPDMADGLAPRLSVPARLRLAEFLQSGGKDTSSLWPRLDTVSCWNDGSSAVFATHLAALCPQAQIEPKGLFATEAAITLPRGGKPGCLPALTSSFIEFISEDGGSHLADELAKGACYRIVITTPGGLYRYDMGDRMRCTGHNGKVGRLVFEGRAGLTSDMVGEKLDEAFVTTALAGLPCAAALSPRRSPKPHYELWLDAAADAASFATQAESALCQNPQYAYARKIGQLGPLAPILKPGFVAERHGAKARAGRRLGDLKHCSLMAD